MNEAFYWQRCLRDSRFFYVWATASVDLCFGVGVLDGLAVVDDFGNLVRVPR